MSINRILLTESAESLFNLSLDEDSVDTLEAYYDAVVEANKEFNLTAITQKDEFVIKHLIDSLAGVPFIPEVQKSLMWEAVADFHHSLWHQSAKILK